jgi:hypothetical protein
VLDKSTDEGTVQRDKWITVIPFPWLVYLAKFLLATSLGYRNRHTLVIPFALSHTYRHPVENAQMANICTKATFQRHGKYPQVTNMAEAFYYILSTVRVWKLSHNTDSRYVIPIKDSQTVQAQTCTETQEEHGERFDQVISTIEKRHQGKWSPSMLAEHCWTLRRDVPQAKCSRYSSAVTVYAIYIFSVI